MNFNIMFEGIKRLISNMRRDGVSDSKRAQENRNF